MFTSITLRMRAVCFSGTLLVHMLDYKVSENNNIDLQHSENLTFYLYNITITLITVLVRFLPYVSCRITAT
jgi:hypothetical protein